MLYSTFYISKFLTDKNLFLNDDYNNSKKKDNNTTESPEIPSIIPDIPEKEINPEEEIPDKIDKNKEIDPKNIPEIEFPNENEVPKIIDKNMNSIN